MYKYIYKYSCICSTRSFIVMQKWVRYRLVVILMQWMHCRSEFVAEVGVLQKLVRGKSGCVTEVGVLQK